MVFNNFVEFMDDETPSDRDLDSYLTQDILVIRKLKYSEKDWESAQDGIIIYLGWYPDMDPSGSYRLEIFAANESLLLAEFTDRRNSVVREAVDICLELAAHGANADEFVRVMEEFAMRYPEGGAG
jgi:hypothetical protein